MAKKKKDDFDREVSHHTENKSGVDHPDDDSEMKKLSKASADARSWQDRADALEAGAAAKSKNSTDEMAVFSRRLNHAKDASSAGEFVNNMGKMLRHGHKPPYKR